MGWPRFPRPSPARVADRAAPPPWPRDVARHILEQVDSTNAEAMRLAPSLTGPVWILARRQLAGRGRRGRAWADPEGNFAATLLMRPEGGAAEAALLSFVASLALHDALSGLIGPTARFALKWPNDLLLNGGKLSGILLESVGPGGQVTALAIGIGVNLASCPDPAGLDPEALAPVSLLQETGLHLFPEDLLEQLAPAFDHRLRQMRDHGFGVIRQAWLARAARLGGTIIARTGQSRTEGRFDGVDESGALILTTARGRVLIPAADIYFREG